MSEMSKIAATLPTALESLNYAEIPIAVVAVISLHMQFALEDVAGMFLLRKIGLRCTEVL